MYKLFVFDLDGTLANTLDSIAYFANCALEKFNLDKIETEKYKLLVGNGALELVRSMMKTVGADSALFDDLSKYYIKTYDENFLYKTKPYEGICELLKRLKDKKIKLAVLSNKPHQTTYKVVQALFGEDFFDICRGNMENVPRKPNPAALFEIMEILDVSPSECIYVGDTSVDILTGKNANVFTVGVLWGFRDRYELEESGADLIVSTPKEILNLLEY